MKEKILQTAYQLFSQFGIKSVSIDDICNDLRISKKTFYTIFETKEELVSQLLEIGRQTHNKKMQAILSASNNVIDSWFLSFNQFNKKSFEKHIALLYDLEKFYPKIWEIHQEKSSEELFKNTKILLQKGIEQQLFRKDMNITAMAALISEVTPKAIQKLDKLSMNNTQKIDFILDTCMRSICSKKGFNYYLQNHNKNQK